MLAGGVDVPEAALHGMTGVDGFGACQAKDPIDSVDGRPYRLVRCQKDEGPLLKGRRVSPARRGPDAGDGVSTGACCRKTLAPVEWI